MKAVGGPFPARHTLLPLGEEQYRRAGDGRDCRQERESRRLLFAQPHPDPRGDRGDQMQHCFQEDTGTGDSEKRLGEDEVRRAANREKLRQPLDQAQDDHIQHECAPLKGAMSGASKCSTQHVLCSRRALLQYRYQRASQASQKVFPAALTVRGPTSPTPVRPSNDASRSGVASSDASAERVWDKTPPGVPALAWAPTSRTASHPWVSGSTYLAQAWPRT